MFALKGGISKTQSPSGIILNHKLNFNAHCKMEVGEYVQTHKEHDNTMQSRAIGVIATTPSNDGGGCYFISLVTIRHNNCRSWTPMPMPSEVVAQVHHLTRRAKAKKTLIFTNARDENRVVFYTAIEQDEDDVNLAHAHDKLVGVGGKDKGNASNTDYNPEQSK